MVKKLSLSFPMRILSEITRIFAPNFLKKKFKWIRFSKEIMLISDATK